MTALQMIFNSEMTHRLGWVLVHFLWQGALVAAVLAGVLTALRKKSANVRYAAACGATLAMVALPVVTMGLVDVPQGQRYAAGTNEGLAVSGEVGAPAVSDGLSSGPDVVVSPSVDIEPSEHNSTEPLGGCSPESTRTETTPEAGASFGARITGALDAALPWMTVGWALGVFGLSVWHLGGWAQLQRLRRRMVEPVGADIRTRVASLAERIGVTRTVETLQSALVAVPAVVGHFKPVILLPASALTGLSPEQIEAILAHELAHIKRCDYMVNMLQTAVEILGFYHPGVWWVSRVIRVERENCCDDIAVAVCQDRVTYARALAAMEEVRGHGRLAVAASGASLFDRIRRLLGADDVRESRFNWAGAAVLLLLLVMAAVPVGLAMSKAAAVGEQADRGNTSLSEYTHTLDNGVTVELVGVCNYPSQGKQWWRPDGSPLGETIETVDGSGYQSGLPGYEIAFGVRNREKCHEFGIADITGGGQRSGLRVNDENIFAVYRAHISKSADRTDVTVQVAGDQWQSVAELKGFGYTTSRRHKGAKILFSSRVDSDGAVVVSVSDELSHTVATRLMAVTRGGKTIRGKAQTSMYDGTGGEILRLQVLRFEGVTPADIEKISYEICPYEYYTFKNVSLKPGFETDVEIERDEQLSSSSSEASDIQEMLRTVELKAADFEQVSGFTTWLATQPGVSNVRNEALNYLTSYPAKQKVHFSYHGEEQTVYYTVTEKPDVVLLDGMKVNNEDSETVSQRAQRLQSREESLRNLSNLGSLFRIYAEENNEKYPDTLEELTPYDDDELLPWAVKHAEYLGRGKTLASKPQTPIAYDKTMLMENGKTNVLFHDGHVEFCEPKKLRALGIEAKKVSGTVHSSDEQIKSLQEIVELYRRQEERTQTLLDAGRASMQELTEIKAKRLAAEAELAKAKGENAVDEDQSEYPKVAYRYFEQIVITPDPEKVRYKARAVSWTQLEQAIAKLDNKESTVLEVAFEPGMISRQRSDPRGYISHQLEREPGFQKAKELVDKHGLEHVSFVGEYSPGDARKGPVSVRMAGEFIERRGIPVNLQSFEDDPLLTIRSIAFERKGALAKVQCAMTSYPFTTWEVTVRLLDKQGYELASRSKGLDNRGIAAGVPANFIDELEFDFGRVDIDAIDRFEISLRQYLPPEEKKNNTVSIEAKVLLADPKTYEKLLAEGKLKKEGQALNLGQAASLIREINAGGHSKLLSAPKVIVRDGENATLSVRDDKTGYELICDVTPGIMDDIVNLDFTIQNRKIFSQQEIEKGQVEFAKSVELAGSSLVPDQNTLAVGGFEVDCDRPWIDVHHGEGCKLIVLLKPAIIPAP